MVTTSLSLSNALSNYTSSLLNKSNGTSSQATSATSDDSVVQAALAKALAGSTTTSSTNSSTKLTVARQHLNLLQQSLAKDIKSALSKAGQTLTGTVDFSLSSDGKLSVSGNEQDKAHINALLANDKSIPSLATRLTNLNKQAQAFDRQNVQTNAAMVAARQAGKGTQNLVSLYQSIMASQSASTAIFSVSDKTSQVAFSGAVETKA